MSHRLSDRLPLDDAESALSELLNLASRSLILETPAGFLCVGDGAFIGLRSYREIRTDPVAPGNRVPLSVSDCEELDDVLGCKTQHNY